jgi:hypothetical protein
MPAVPQQPIYRRFPRQAIACVDVIYRKGSIIQKNIIFAPRGKPWEKIDYAIVKRNTKTIYAC